MIQVFKIQVFKDGKHHSELHEWCSAFVPNNAYIYDSNGHWWHKLIDRTIPISIERVPAVYKAWMLLLN